MDDENLSATSLDLQLSKSDNQKRSASQHGDASERVKAVRKNLSGITKEETKRRAKHPKDVRYSSRSNIERKRSAENLLLALQNQKQKSPPRAQDNLPELMSMQGLKFGDNAKELNQMVSNKNQKEDDQLRKPLGRPVGTVGGGSEEDVRRYHNKLWKQANPPQ